MPIRREIVKSPEGGGGDGGLGVDLLLGELNEGTK